MSNQANQSSGEKTPTIGRKVEFFELQANEYYNVVNYAIKHAFMGHLESAIGRLSMWAFHGDSQIESVNLSLNFNPANDELEIVARYYSPKHRPYIMAAVWRHQERQFSFHS